ncbi:MAG: hypothetical protein ACI4R8_00255 [Candidatus Caccovivens sp.]
MNVLQFNKIVVVSLCDKFSKSVGESLSQTLGMIFCDTKELMEYELSDIKTLEKISSKEYLLNCEKKVIRHIASFENVVVSINYDYFVHNFESLKSGALAVFVKLPKNFVKENGNALDFIEYSEHSKKLQDLTQITLDIRKADINYVCEKIIEKLGGIL